MQNEYQKHQNQYFKNKNTRSLSFCLTTKTSSFLIRKTLTKMKNLIAFEKSPEDIHRLSYSRLHERYCLVSE